jgi:hypothetical protein
VDILYLSHRYVRIDSADDSKYGDQQNTKSKRTEDKQGTSQFHALRLNPNMLRKKLLVTI